VATKHLIVRHEGEGPQHTLARVSACGIRNYNDGRITRQTKGRNAHMFGPEFFKLTLPRQRCKICQNAYTKMSASTKP
jgi:hypothetical protein